MQESNFFLTVRGLSELLSSGESSSVELTEAYLDRADELDVPPFELPSEPIASSRPVGGEASCTASPMG